MVDFLDSPALPDAWLISKGEHPGGYMLGYQGGDEKKGVCPMLVSGVYEGWIHPHKDQKCNLLSYTFHQCFPEEHTCSHHVSSPKITHRWAWSSSIPQTVRQSSPTGWSCPQGLSPNRPSILWDKDDNPYPQGVGRSKPLSSEMATLDQFLLLPLEIKLSHTCLPHARPFVWQADNDIHSWSSKPSVGIPVRCETTVTQT